MKAQVGDLLTPITVFFMLLMLAVLSAQVLVSFRDTSDFTGVPLETLNKGIEFYQGLDMGLVILFLALVLINTMTAFKVTTHPIWLGIQIVLFFILFFYPVLIQDVWDEFKVDPALADGISVYPFSALLVDNLIYAYMGTVFLWIAAFFIKIRFFDPGSLNNELF